MKLILTCEHGGNEIPHTFQPYFENENTILNSHRGYDLGALDVFQKLKPLSDFSKYSKTSRLLIELNRSLHCPNLFSKFTKQLSKEEKKVLINSFYFLYRNAVESEIKNYIQNNQSVVHISLHSFTPILNNIERTCDIGLLFDSSKKEEKKNCKQLKSILKTFDSNIKIRYNYPYLGKSDGFTTYLRKKFPDNYMGIELEINQKFSNNNVMDEHIKTILFKALKELITTAH
tara:strand:- start:26596 stop:27288 length:693 start_codon:yes stop_codon:yes gene_type:complete